MVIGFCLWSCCFVFSAVHISSTCFTCWELTLNFLTQAILHQQLENLKPFRNDTHLERSFEMRPREVVQ
ncbi:hypothetical protein QL285_015264 [Trifolium repens]|nr:hypothetical protein QL285_015264 [Trifolium repens]